MLSSEKMQWFAMREMCIRDRHTRSILKFINHYVAYGCSYLFEYKRGISFFYQVMKQRVGIRQQEAVVFMVQFAYLFVYIGQQTDIVTWRRESWQELASILFRLLYFSDSFSRGISSFSARPRIALRMGEVFFTHSSGQSRHFSTRCV